MSENFKRKVLPILVVLIGFSLMIGMASLKEELPKKEVDTLVPLVKTRSLQAKDIELKIKGSGIVKSLSEIRVVPQVSGKIKRRSSKMSIGSSFKKGDLLYEIDPSDYLVQKEIAEAEVATRKVQYEMEEQEARLAKDEWLQYQKDNPSEKATLLTLRKPQMDLAKANLKAAEARLRLAKLNLKRTKIRAPFDGIVRAKFLDEGQFASPGNPLAEIVSTERAELSIFLEEGDYRNLDFSKKAKATLSKTVNGKEQHWTAFLKKGAASLDPKSRLIPVTLDIPKPYSGKNKLFISSYVDVEIEGKELRQVFEVESYAIHNGKIWILKDGKLDIRSAEIVQNEAEKSIISKGIQSGELLITSNLDYAVQGMSLEAEKE